jgi:predicted membrane protein (TIGR00267 family)
LEEPAKVSDPNIEEPDQPPADDGVISESLAKINNFLETTRSKGIIRRYLAMNAFDGAMTSLGVVIGSYIASVEDPKAVLDIILLGAVAMALSGFTGTYMVESAERKGRLNEIEESSPSEAHAYRRAARFVSAFAAIIDGSAPFIASLPCLFPFALALLGVIEIHVAFYAAVGGALTILFVIGAFLGRISESSIIYSGLKMVVAGSLVALIAIALGQQ